MGGIVNNVTVRAAMGTRVRHYPDTRSRKITAFVHATFVQLKLTLSQKSYYVAG